MAFHSVNAVCCFEALFCVTRSGSKYALGPSLVLQSCFVPPLQYVISSMHTAAGVVMALCFCASVLFPWTLSGAHCNYSASPVSANLLIAYVRQLTSLCYAKAVCLYQ